MSNETSNSRIAVFTRNHREHLKRGAAKNAGEPAVFRSRARWSTAEEAVREQGRVEVYIAEIDEDNTVQYVAQLTRVILDPSSKEQEVKDLLDAAPAANEGEKLWEDSGAPVQTLYVLRCCRKLPIAIPVTELVKRDGTPISPDYGYSYSIVQELPATRIG